jgi:hypothetical protein
MAIDEKRSRHQRTLMAVCAGRQRTQDGEGDRRRRRHRLLDLEDAVAEAEKPKARSMVSAFLKANAQHRARLWVRINPLQGPHALADLAAVMPASRRHHAAQGARPRRCGVAGSLSDGARGGAGASAGRHQSDRAGHRNGRGMFTTGSYAGAPRVVAMTWGAEDLATRWAPARIATRTAATAFTYELARSLCLLGAAAAGVPPSRRFKAIFATKRACASAPRKCGARISRHAGDSSGAGRCDQRSLHAERRGTGGGAGDRRSVRGQSPARARSATRAPCSIGRIWPARRRCWRSRSRR